MQAKTSGEAPQSERAMFVLAASMAVGGSIILVYSAQAPDLGKFLSSAGVALVVACSALLSGGFLGFLFGIPRTLQQGSSPSPSPEERTAGELKDGRQETSYAVNTNLEQISDWLTKILVGVGLTQIATIPAALKEFADYVGPGLGDYPGSRIFAIAMLLFFTINGFLISYLWTRFYLAGALKRADASSRLAAVETKLDMMDINARALSMVSRVLNKEQSGSAPSQDELSAAVAAASDDTKAQIFRQAAWQRHDTWRSLPDKPKMERTIPVFRALIASDTENVYHANHGQLGFALKDQRNPDWAGARDELTEAIKLRGDWRASGMTPWYELVRAMCYIRLDPAFKNNTASDARTRQAITADLEVAFADADTRDAAIGDEVVTEWMELNGLTASSLTPPGD